MISQRKNDLNCLGIFIFLTLATSSLKAAEFSPLFGIGQENFDFRIEDIDGPKSQIEYKPNMAGVSRIGINAYGFGIGYSFRGTDELDETKGKTDFFDLQIGYHTKKWGIDAFDQVYTGFYTTNTAQTQLYPDLKFQHYGLMGRYALNDSEFSVNGLLDQSENIKQTASKYYVVGGLRHHSMETPISLLQQDYAGFNLQLENLRKMSVNSLNVGLGAGKYWVSEGHFFIGALLDLLGTYGMYTYEDVNLDKTSSSYMTLSFNLRLGLGYAGETYKFGLGVTGDTTTLKTPGIGFIKPQAIRSLFYIRFTF